MKSDPKSFSVLCILPFLGSTTCSFLEEELGKDNDTQATLEEIKSLVLLFFFKGNTC